MSVHRSILLIVFSVVLAVSGLVPLGQSSAQDVRRICSEKYQAAKAAGTLNGEAWPQFYSKCAAETKANPPAATATPPAAVAQPPAPAPVVAAPPPSAPAPAVAAPAVTPSPVNPLKKSATKPMAPAAATAPSTAVFPTAIAPAYAGQKPGIARRKTCLDQYNA
ncbi:MAG: hypothetical protein ACREDU_06825, partial [Methylocella sp.]